MSFVDHVAQPFRAGVGLTLRSGGWRDDGAVRAHLEGDVRTNLFSLSWLEAHGLRPKRIPNAFETLIVEDRGRLVGSCLVLASRTAMPCAASESAAMSFGHQLRRRGAELDHIVGRAENVGALWDSYRDGRTSRLDRSQVYCVLERGRLKAGSESVGVRLARLDDLDPLVMASAKMYREETLSDPFAEDEESFYRMHRMRIIQGMSYVLRGEDGQVIFKADVSCSSRYGAQIAGVFTDPTRRGEGIARRSLETICGGLLERFPFVTLYVNKKNLPALSLYDALGFYRHRDYRTIFVT